MYFFLCHVIELLFSRVLASNCEAQLALPLCRLFKKLTLLMHFNSSHGPKKAICFKQHKLLIANKLLFCRVFASACEAQLRLCYKIMFLPYKLLNSSHNYIFFFKDWSRRQWCGQWLVPRDGQSGVSYPGSHVDIPLWQMAGHLRRRLPHRAQASETRRPMHTIPAMLVHLFKSVAKRKSHYRIALKSFSREPYLVN